MIPPPPNKKEQGRTGLTSTQMSLTRKVGSRVFIDPVAMPTCAYTSHARLCAGKIKECFIVLVYEHVNFF